MICYIAGGVSGNLKAAWKWMAKNNISVDGFIEGLARENFWLGGRLVTGYKTSFRP